MVKINPDGPAVTASELAAEAEAKITSSSSMRIRALVSGALGSALEWFDFGIYGALSATLFPTLFFSGLGPAGALIASFATFGVGFAARPLGALLCGYLGDRYGRRPVLLGTFLGMGISSLLIGLLPGNQGVAIAVVLVGLRFLQGFSVGGEATGAQLMSIEHAPKNRRGIYGAFINVGSPISQVLSNVVLAVLAATMTAEAFAAWGWRIPFLLSVLLVAVGVYIRLRLAETPAFRVQKAVVKDSQVRKVGGLRVFRDQPKTMIMLILVWAGSGMTFYVVAVYGLSYMTNQGHFEQSQGFTMLVVSNAIAIAGSLFGGRISDSIGRKKVVYLGMIAQLVGIVAFFPAANSGSFALVLLSATVAVTGVQFSYGAQPALYAEQFPTASRFTGSALALTISILIFSAPAPLLAAALASTGWYWGIAAINVVALVVSALALLGVRENYKIDLTTFVSTRS